MQNSAPIRFLAAGLAVSAMLSPALTLAAQSTPTPATNPGTVAPASSTLPATQPTTTPPPPPAVPLTPSQLPPTHAQVTYTGGTLSISASNSSLNQILREISRETGIKISGGVTDERVFGQYGPDGPSQILSALLDGTGSNMLLVNGDADRPAELILTPRQGGPTPPSPNAHAFDETHNSANADSPENQSAEQPSPDQSRPVANPPVTPGTPDPAAAATDPQSPNGVKTPQQIYDQLQRLRQQPPAANPQ
jgi:hypothetical protein